MFSPRGRGTVRTHVWQRWLQQQKNPMNFLELAQYNLFSPSGIKQVHGDGERHGGAAERGYTGGDAGEDGAAVSGGCFVLLVLSEHPQAVSLMPGDSSGFSECTSLWRLSGQMVFQAPGRLHINVKPLSTEVLFLVQQEYSARNRDVLFCVYEIRTEGIKPPPGIFSRGFAGGNNAL